MLAPSPTFLSAEEFNLQKQPFVEALNSAQRDYLASVELLPSLNIPLGSSIAAATPIIEQYGSLLRRVVRLYQAFARYRTFVVENNEDGEKLDTWFRNEIKQLLANYTVIKEKLTRELYNIDLREPTRYDFIDEQQRVLTNVDNLLPKQVPIIIYPRQQAHYRRLQALYEEDKRTGLYPSYIDQTKPGGGKTYVNTILVPREFAVYSPAILVDKWRGVAVEAEKVLVEALSYEALAGNRINQSHSRFLRRTPANNVVVTTEFDDFLRRDGWLIFDEYQRLRNGNIFTNACLALICRLAEARQQGWSKSRIALLSGTPGDKDANTYSIILLLGLTKYRELYEYDPSLKIIRMLPGWDEVVAWMFRINPEQARSIFEGSAKPTSMLTKAFIRIVIPAIASRMPVNDKGVYRNGHFQIVPEDRETLANALVELRKAVRPSEEGISRSRNSFGKITTALTHVEAALINSMIRDTAILLTQFPTCKVILVVWYVESRTRIIKQITDYAVSRLGVSPEKAENFVVELGGKISAKKRQASIDSFNANSLDTRVCVMNPEVGGMGLDLDDKVGPSTAYPYGMPRYTLVIPNYNLLTLLQAMARASRANTQSTPFAFIYYAQDTPQKQIMDNLYEKSLTAFLLGGGKEDVEEVDEAHLSREENQQIALSYDVVYPCTFRNYNQPNIYRLETYPSGYTAPVLDIKGIVFPYIDLENHLVPVGDAPATTCVRPST